MALALGVSTSSGCSTAAVTRTGIPSFLITLSALFMLFRHQPWPDQARTKAASTPTSPPSQVRPAQAFFAFRLQFGVGRATVQHPDPVVARVRGNRDLRAPPTDWATGSWPLVAMRRAPAACRRARSDVSASSGALAALHQSQDPVAQSGVEEHVGRDSPNTSHHRIRMLTVPSLTPECSRNAKKALAGRNLRGRDVRVETAFVASLVGQGYCRTT